MAKKKKTSPPDHQRRGGAGCAALMGAAEATARECGKTRLVLDAVTDSYRRLDS